MQTKLLLSFVLFLALTTSCTKSKLPEPPPDTPEMALARGAIESTNQALLSGKWKVSSCTNQGTDVTAKFDDYNFSFLSNGSVSATNDYSAMFGKWSTAYVDDKIRVTFIFQNVPVFNAVAGNWTVTESTSATLQLQESIQKTDVLSFSKK